MKKKFFLSAYVLSLVALLIIGLIYKIYRPTTDTVTERVDVAVDSSTSIVLPDKVTVNNHAETGYIVTGTASYEMVPSQFRSPPVVRESEIKTRLGIKNDRVQ